MVVYGKRYVRRLLEIEFIRFCMVGGSGFVVNISLLAGLTSLAGLSVFWAQLLSAEVALFSNFILHDRWTYQAHQVHKSFKRLLIEFHATSWPAILGSTVTVSAGVRLFHLNKFIALVISSGLALIWNFVWSKFVVWRDVNPQLLEAKE
jgi:putative flippase GtrA